MKLLTDVDVNTIGTTNEIGRMFRGHGDSIYSFYVWGALGGGTVTLWCSPDKTNWFKARTITHGQADVTVADLIMVHVRAGFVRAELAGSAGAVDVNAQLI